MFLFKKLYEIRRKSTITFEKVAYEWLEQKRSMIKKSTYYRYLYLINKYLIFYLKDFTLKDLEEYDFNKLIEKLTKTLAAKTVKDILINLKSILNYIEEEYNCNTKVKKIKSPQVSTEPLVILSKQERRKIIKYCLEENSLKTLGIYICLNTGLRIGEICALRWKGINLEKREINIRNTLQRIYDESQKKTRIIIESAKTRTSIRNIPITNKLYNLLYPLRKKYKDDDFFLTGNSEKYIEPRRYQQIFKNVLKTCDIKKTYKFHILRHTFATECIEVGIDPKSLSEILGHSDVSITLNRYVHSSYKLKRKYLEKLQ